MSQKMSFVFPIFVAILLISAPFFAHLADASRPQPMPAAVEDPMKTTAIDAQAAAQQKREKGVFSCVGLTEEECLHLDYIYTQHHH